MALDEGLYQEIKMIRLLASVGSSVTVQVLGLLPLCRLLWLLDTRAMSPESKVAKNTASRAHSLCCRRKEGHESNTGKGIK